MFHAIAKNRGGPGEIFRAQVGLFLSLDVPPEILDGIELQGITGQSLDGEPGTLTCQVRAHVAAAMSGEAIPHEDELAATKVAAQFLKERHEAFAVVAAGFALEAEIGAFASALARFDRPLLVRIDPAAGVV